MSNSVTDSVFYHSKLRDSLGIPGDELKCKTRSGNASPRVDGSNPGDSGSHHSWGSISSRNAEEESSPAEATHYSRRQPSNQSKKEKHSEQPIFFPEINKEDTISMSSVHSRRKCSNFESGQMKASKQVPACKIRRLRPPHYLLTRMIIRDVLRCVFYGILSLLFIGLLITYWIWHRSVPFLTGMPKIGQLYYLQDYLSSTAKVIPKKLEAIDSKAENRVEEYMKNMEDKFQQQATSFVVELSVLKMRITEMQSALNALQCRAILTVNDALQVNNSVVEKGVGEQTRRPLSLDDVRTAARRIVEAEIRKHAADGIGKVDYALGSGGGKVVDHSEGFNNRRVAAWELPLRLWTKGILKHPMANRMLEPSLGEPGQCLPLAGSNVHVDIALRTAILAEEVTLEHASKDVAYDISSAPKDFRIYGKYSSQERTEHDDDWSLLGKFTYDIEKPAAQTFNLWETAKGKLSNRIRLHVLSNYGSPSHTCIYRLRVHGFDSLKPTSRLLV